MEVRWRPQPRALPILTSLFRGSSWSRPTGGQLDTLLGKPTIVLKRKALILLICQRCQRTARGRWPSKGKQPWAQILAPVLIGQMSLVVSLSAFVSSKGKMEMPRSNFTLSPGVSVWIKEEMFGGE